MTTTSNNLYFGDNLDVLREHIGDESVDLIYLDPPFNSARDYNVLFSSPKGENSKAQIELGRTFRPPTAFSSRQLLLRNPVSVKLDGTAIA